MIEIRYGVKYIITDSGKLKKKKRKKLVTDDEDACTLSMLKASFEHLLFAGREGGMARLARPKQLQFAVS